MIGSLDCCPDDDFAKRVDAARRERDKRLADLGDPEETPDHPDCREAEKRIRDKFERRRGEIALQFVESRLPPAWFSARWLQEAITYWYMVGVKGSVARENLKNVTKAMGRPRFADRARAGIKRMGARSELHQSSVLAEVTRLTPVCQRLRKVCARYISADRMGLLAEWIYSGSVSAEDLVADTLGFDKATLETDFNAVRAYFGGELKRVGQTKFLFVLPPIGRDEPDSEEMERLRQFLRKGVKSKRRPGRLAEMLVSERYGVPIRHVAELASKERSYSPVLPERQPFRCPLDGEVFGTPEALEDHLNTHP